VKSGTANTTKVLAAIGAGAVVLKGVRFGMEVFGPTRPYRLLGAAAINPDSETFANRLALASDAILHRDACIAVLKNGSEFYPAELEAIRAAERTIHLEAYEFQKGDVTRNFLKAMAERARSGVKVRLTIDDIGSWRTERSYFDMLTNAGGQVVLYHRVRSRDWPYFDHRTHRKLLIVDSSTAFVGGAGWADHWIKNRDAKPPWRDTMLRVRGGAALSLDVTFARKWVASTGEILWPPGSETSSPSQNGSRCMVVSSEPGYGVGHARVLFEMLLDSAKTKIDITSPYFLPDRSARHALIRAVQERGVTVRVITAGSGSDHNAVRRLSETMSAKLIRHGVRYHEYEPGMIHAKLMTIDGIVTVAGSTNFDHRSFALNSEVNLAVCDREVTGVIERQFEEDLRQSRQMAPGSGKSSSLQSRVLSTAAWVLRREA
jgi:cardiolipin synthase